jgi:small basic protein (TIGR04137 family)
MTVDRSLKLKSGLVRARSVLSRAERLAELKEAGRWHEGDSILGLPKVKVRRVKRRKAAKAEAAEAAAPVAAGAAAAAPAGAPAAKGAPKGAPAAKGAPEKAAPKDKGAKK